MQSDQSSGGDGGRCGTRDWQNIRRAKVSGWCGKQRRLVGFGETVGVDLEVRAETNLHGVVTEVAGAATKFLGLAQSCCGAGSCSLAHSSLA
ncbi:hypothetical protein VNO80_25405 [Phaseolus coccineus]|uniref:Uncharacterized protein n=1 Tax=Phaseolus coccineus TaxID=3886 RepID=A0AAN9QNZ4_PHACN